VLERLLCRVAASRHADRFLLKGALLFSLWYDEPHRPTRDADLLGFGPATADDHHARHQLGHAARNLVLTRDAP
jgi:hypothetical protein